MIDTTQVATEIRHLITAGTAEASCSSRGASVSRPNAGGAVAGPAGRDRCRRETGDVEALTVGHPGGPPLNLRKR